MSASDDYEEEPETLVIDTGSEFVKAGWAGDDIPRAEFPSVVGRRSVPAYWNPGPMSWAAAKHCHPPRDIYVGDQAYYKRHEMRLRYPIERGIVTNWDDMEEILKYTFYWELRSCPEEVSVLLTDPVSNPKANREKMTEIMFETFNVPAFYLANQSVMALYASGKTTGVVVQSGSITRTVPVYEGYALNSAVNTLNIGGRDITDYLFKLTKKGYFAEYHDFYTRSQKVRDYKEKCAYIAENYESELKQRNWSNKNYELPDGQVISGGDQLFKCSEIIFNPKYVNKDNDGVSLMLIKSAVSCDIDVRNEMMKNIVLSGGNTMIDGMDKRLKMEIGSILFKPLVNGFVREYSKNRVYNDYLNIMYAYYGIDNSNICHKYNSYVVGCNEFNIVSSENRKYNVWIGGSIFAQQSTSQEYFIPKNEYDERGASIVHLKRMSEL